MKNELAAAAKSRRGRTIVASTRPIFTRCCLRRWCYLVVLISLVFIYGLCFQRRNSILLVDNVQAWNEFLDMADSIKAIHDNHSEVVRDKTTHKFMENAVKRDHSILSTAPAGDEADDQSEKLSEEKVMGKTRVSDDVSKSNQFITSYDNLTIHSDMPVVVHFPAYMDDGIEMRLELDGLVGSKAIQLLSDANASMLYPNVVWIGSTIPERFCNMRMVRQALEFYRSHSYPRLKMKSDWSFHLLDWDDHPHRLNRCKNLDKLVGQNRVYYWKRSSVVGRHWNATTQTVESGNVSTHLEDGVTIRPFHLATRTDIVKGIEAAVATLTNNSNMMTLSEISEYVVTKDRQGDVAHHWPATGGMVDRGTRKGRNDLLRTATSLTLETMRYPPYNLSDVFCGMQGVARDQGRGSTNSAYINSILRYKIMVVAQRDIFEGHLRLFEALASGAMVLHDRILSVPPGLEENVNIVYFDNQNELKEKIMFYLTHHKERLDIARRGRKLAMCQSRTWHRMEQIILGRTVTPCHE